MLKNSNREEYTSKLKKTVQNSTQNDAGPGKRDWQALTGYKVAQQAVLSEIDSQRPGYKAA